MKLETSWSGILGQDSFHASYPEVYRGYVKKRGSRHYPGRGGHRCRVCTLYPFGRRRRGISRLKKGQGDLVRGQVDELERVQRLLKKNLEQTRIKADNKHFSPHFTLGRFKNRVDSRLLEAVIQNFGHCASEPCPIRSMVLFKSDLRPSGAVHTPLFEAEFTGY